MNDDFLFGAATSAYQIEGAWNEAGKVPSIWDEISHGSTRLKVRNGHTGDIACDHYHHWKEDVKLMKELGLKAYRFSISWSRICGKDGCFNLKGIKFYSDLVDELIKNGIEPFATLFHWDLPKWLDDIGGWGNPESVDAFVKYAESMFAKLGKVKYWITFNEPAVFIPNFWGHNDFPEAVRNVLIAHGRAVQLYNEKYDGKIGISLNLMPVFPSVHDQDGDRTAVENADKRQNKIWLDPIYKGCFPDGINELFGLDENSLSFSESEKRVVSEPIDFLGINYYTAITLGHARTASRGFPMDEMGVERRPYGLYHLLETLKARYGDIETYITENGCAYSDTLTQDGRIHDKRRIDYIRSHLRYCDYSIKKGLKLKGYFYWSLMDNFEWMYGYTKRFGLLHVNYPTQQRIPKDSFNWYKNIINNNKFREKELRLE